MINSYNPILCNLLIFIPDLLINNLYIICVGIISSKVFPIFIKIIINVSLRPPACCIF